MNTNNQKLEEYYFNKKSRKKILSQLSKKIKLINNKKDYKILVREVRNSYNDVEINNLKKEYEKESGLYSNDSIIKFLTLFIALAVFINSFLSSIQDVKTTRLITLLGTLELSSKSNKMVAYFTISLLAILIFYICRRVIFTKKPKKLADVTFLLQEALKIPEPLL
ncbi:hypothetical protein LKF67_1807 [Lactococcus lactis subsp. lactis]|uniref:hypothetical protein n=1 Tax=Lactococcus lactis TaxID=1358 RepID=UPI00071DDA5A|nr:hypothetical protein [Lactococcus lactis]KST89360.1 hypothetical protein LKF67_1807 [Lactococcus lactis subsp. lactis]